MHSLCLWCTFPSSGTGMRLSAPCWETDSNRKTNCGRGYVCLAPHLWEGVPCLSRSCTNGPSLPRANFPWLTHGKQSPAVRMAAPRDTSRAPPLPRDTSPSGLLRIFAYWQPAIVRHVFLEP